MASDRDICQKKSQNLTAEDVSKGGRSYIDITCWYLDAKLVDGVRGQKVKGSKKKTVREFQQCWTL